MDGSKALKVWSADKSNGKIIRASKFEELVVKAKAKFHIDETDTVTFVLSDGCQIDDNDSFLSLMDMIEVHILRDGESLNLPSSSNTSVPSDVCGLIEKLRKRKTIEKGIKEDAKKSNRKIRVSVGWFHYSFISRNYRQMRRNKDGEGGTFEHIFEASANYQDVLNVAANFFFINGKSREGKLNKLHTALGRGDAEEVQRDGFTMAKYEKECSKVKCRIYLLTKPKITATEDSDDSHSSSSLSLPDLSGGINSLSDDEMVSLITSPQSSGGTDQQLPMPLLQDCIATPSTDVARRSSNTGGIPTTMPVRQGGGTPTVSFRFTDDRLCTICMEREKSSFLYPCGHTFCTVCSVQVVSSNSPCPICRQPVSKVNSLFNF